MSTLSPSTSRPETRAAALLAAAAIFLASWALLHTGFYSAHQLVDTPTYERYGDAIRAGDVPYRDFAVEYPPGALPVFAAPAYLGSYDETFGWLMAALGVACLLLVALAGAPWWSVGFVAISPLLVGSLAFSRFDFWPAALLTSAVCALLADRHRLGFGLLAGAVAAKLFPLAVVPLAIAWTLRRRGGRELAVSAAVGAGVLLLAFGPFAAVSPRGLWSSLSGQLTRPLEIESLAASVFTTFGHPVMVVGHGSQNIAGHGTAAALSSLGQLAVLLALWIAFARGPADRQRLARYAGACICAFVVFGKVLSPQYLIWLVPLVALVGGRRGIAALALLAAALLATQAWFPDRYWDYVYAFDRAWVVLTRNVLLLALLAVLSLPRPARARSS